MEITAVILQLKQKMSESNEIRMQPISMVWTHIAILQCANYCNVERDDN